MFPASKVAARWEACLTQTGNIFMVTQKRDSSFTIVSFTLAPPQEDCWCREGASRWEGLLPQPRPPEAHEEEEEEGVPESV